MAYFARIENGIVQATIAVGTDWILDENGVEQESLGIAFCQNLYGADTEWVQTSYNSNFRKRHGIPGDTWDAQRDAFIAPQPFDSWTLNETTCQWEAPTPKPDDENLYMWDESTTSWVRVGGDE